MEINIDRDDLLKALFVIYVIVCILCTSLITAFLIAPLAIWSNMYLFYETMPKALCMVSNDRDRCVAVMEEIAEELELKQIIIYEEVELNKFEHVGIIELQDEVDVDIDLDD